MLRAGARNASARTRPGYWRLCCARAPGCALCRECEDIRPAPQPHACLARITPPVHTGFQLPAPARRWRCGISALREHTMFGNSDLFAFTRPDPTPEQIEIARSRGWFPVSRHENLDAHILSLFRVWLNVCAERDALGDDDEAAIIAVVTRMTAIEN